MKLTLAEHWPTIFAATQVVGGVGVDTSNGVEIFSDQISTHPGSQHADAQVDRPLHDAVRIRIGFGGGVNSGVYANSGESVTTYRPTVSSTGMATSVELDLNTTYQISDSSHLLVGLYLLGIGGIHSARDAASYQPDRDDTITYGGVRFAWVKSSWWAGSCDRRWLIYRSRNCRVAARRFPRTGRHRL